MAWTYEDLKKADPGGDDLTAAADKLNTAMADPVTVAVSVAAIHGALMLAPTGDWLRIQALAGMAFSSGFPATPTPQDQAIAAARLAITLAESKVETIAPESWPQVAMFLGGLQQAGVVSSATMAKLSAMASHVAPKWQPPITVRDLWIVRGQPDG